MFECTESPARNELIITGSSTMQLHIGTLFQRHFCIPFHLTALSQWTRCNLLSQELLEASAVVVETILGLLIPHESAHHPCRQHVIMDTRINDVLGKALMEA